MADDTLDITIGALTGLCDYGLQLDVREPTDFMRGETGSCTLCGPARSGHTAAQHVMSKGHMQRMADYIACRQQLILYNMAARAEHGELISTRETVLVYLGERLTRAHVVAGVDRYNMAAVSYLLHRVSTPELVGAFRMIQGTEDTRKGMCVVCMERPSSVMFDTCRHVCACGVCLAELRSRGPSRETPRCPMCRVCTTATSVFIS